MSRKISIITLLLAIFASVNMYGAETAAQVLDRAADKFRKAQSVSAGYTLTASGSGSASGTVTLAGDKFHMTSPQLTTWYDGVTQWTYVAADNEVTVSTPTPHELQQINPLLIINSFRQGYTPVLLKAPADKRKVRLTANNKKADIKQAVVTINATTYLPDEISLTMANGQIMSIKLTKVTIGKKLPADTFRFDKKKYPRAEVIDLR